jgi:hypothetical protein
MQNVDLIDEWVGELARLWDAVGKPLEADRLAIYQRELADIPLGLLERTISRVIRENTYSNVPPVGVIWKALRVELGNPNDVMDAIGQWVYADLGRCVVRFGVGHSVAVETEEVHV